MMQVTKKMMDLWEELVLAWTGEEGTKKLPSQPYGGNSQKNPNIPYYILVLSLRFL
jgi:hypothetical protein